MTIQTRSERLSKLPKYLFAALDEKKKALIAKGVDVINLGIGDPDLPPPPRMIETLKEALSTPEFHQYPSYNGADFFRKTIADYLKNHHNVNVDYATEVLVLIGSKEGLAHFPQAVLNTGDTALITNPCYPVHLQSMILAGVEPISIPLYESNGFLPDLKSVPKDHWEKAKLIVLNYPNNPTSAVATREFFVEIVALAHKHNFIIVQDAAYIDVCLEGEKQPSILSVLGAKDVAIEFFSLSKMFNACGWRMGFAAGNKDLIASLGKFKTAVDSGQFTALQYAGSVAMKECLPDMARTLEIYRERKKILCGGLEDMDLKYLKSNSAFYVWSKIPEKYKSQDYANFLLENLGIVASPGIGFGTMGDDYIRFSLTSPTERIAEATKRMKEAHGR